MTLTTRTAATLTAAIALLAATPVASAGIDRGVGVEPSVMPMPDAVDRYLANDRIHAATVGVVDRHPAEEVNLASATIEESLWNTRLVAASIAAAFALGVLGTAFVVRRRTMLTP
jgi:hypothetical protein